MPGVLTDTRDKVACLATAILFAVFIVLLPRYTDVAKHFYYLLGLFALGHLALNPRRLAEADRTRRLLFALIALNFAWIAVTFYANGQPGRGDSFLWNRHFHLLLLIPVYYLFRRFRLRDDVLLFTLLASVLLAFGDIMLDLHQGVDHRLQGMNPNAFGPILLVSAAILLFHGLLRPERSRRMLALAGCALALACVILSMSRSTWLTLVVLSLILVVYLTRALPAWKRLGAAGLAIMLLASAYLLPVVQSRVDDGIGTVTAYFASDDYRDDSRLGSFGTRAELWKTAWLTFVENPLLGVGVGGFQESARANSERFRVNDEVHRFKYAHNQYLVALATRGVPGLLLFLSILLLPIAIARARAPESPGERIAQASTIAICLTYLVGCLAEDHFEGKSAIMFVSVVLPLMLARLDAGEPAATTPAS